MARALRLKRGNTAQNATYLGAEGEVVYNTQTKKLIVHDGVTVGGVPVSLSATLLAWDLTATPDVLPVAAIPGSLLEATVAGSYLTKAFDQFDLGVVASDGVSVIRIPEAVASEAFVTTAIATALAGYTPSPAQVITYTASRSSIEADNGKWIRYNSGTDVTYSVDQEGTTLALGDEIHIEQVGAGKVTVAVALPADGTVVNESAFLPKTRGARAVLTIKKTVHGATRADDIFTVFGGLEAV